MTDATDEPDRADELFNQLYGDLDSTGGLLDALANTLAAADAAGHPVESDDDRRADIDNGLQMAFEEMDSDDPDPETVAEHLRYAHSAAGDFGRGLDKRTEDFEIPDHVDAGVYDTLGDFAQYVAVRVHTLRQQAEEWAALSGE